MTDIRGAKPARQQRSRKTRDDLLHALERVLRTKDFYEISVAEVAAEAGVTAGSIYRRFEGGLIEVLFVLTWAIIEGNAQDDDISVNILSSSGLREALLQTSRTAWRQLTRNAHVFRAAYVHGHMRPELVGKPRSDLEARALSGFRIILETFRPEIKRADFDHAVVTIAMLYNTAFLERALFPDRLPAWSGEVDTETYARDVAELAYGYLTTSSANTAIDR